MKKYFLLTFVCLCLTSVSFAQSVITLFNSANEFFDRMREEKFQEAHAAFDESVKTKLTEANLKELWTRMAAEMGKAESLDAVQSRAQDEYFVVTVNGKFEKGEQNFLVVFNKTNKIVGLFLQPKSASAAYKLPAYADTASYKEQQVYIQTPGHQLAAVITTPKNRTRFPMVVMVHGSGPGDMDETVGANKPFKDLAAGLASKGIGSVRYVKRTLIYQNEFGGAFTVKEEVLDDAVAALTMARGVAGADPKQLYLLGHSLGGMLAPRIATLVPDLKGLVLAAAPARKLTDVIADQNRYAFSLVKDTTAEAKAGLQKALTEVERSRISKIGTMKADSAILGLPAAYWADLNSYDQVALAKNLKQRILVIQGGNDFQVTETDYKIWENTLGKKKNATLKLYPTLNHLFSSQAAKGTMAQYQTAANVDAALVIDLANWISQPK
ncbi:dienelactone hydrolase [Pedobacter yulinensis]|uniref:Dienelactone hydrolase n=1 Tax=Pedobacter yulinensis TaxID=2126353 RepID=A0A2T3HMT0_9SPHI|nr:DUF3887 domain-containing protein [Pedobacter yulinensis]PST83736.1 dienelactone hydrolase [Pedobacter yulinensis]